MPPSKAHAVLAIGVSTLHVVFVGYVTYMFLFGGEPDAPMYWLAPILFDAPLIIVWPASLLLVRPRRPRGSGLPVHVVLPLTVVAMAMALLAVPSLRQLTAGIALVGGLGTLMWGDAVYRLARFATALFRRQP